MSTEEILKTLLELQKDLDRVKENQRWISEILQYNQNSGPVWLESNENYTLPFKLPVNSLEELSAIEDQLKEENCQKQMILQLRKLGGKNTVGVVGYMLQHVMTPSLALGFSFYGTKEKMQFSSLKLCEIIFEVTRLHQKEATDQQIKEIIQNWLRHAKERMAKQNNQRTIGKKSVNNI